MYVLQYAGFDHLTQFQRSGLPHPRNVQGSALPGEVAIVRVHLLTRVFGTQFLT